VNHPPSHDLLDRIESVTRALERDPGAGLVEAEAIYRAAEGAEHHVVAAAGYLLGQALAMTGHLDAARDLVAEAAARWQQAGDPLRAVRTRAGLMQLLTDGGSPADAIALGRSSLRDLDALDPHGDHREIAGLLHQNLGVAAAHAGGFDIALEAYGRAETAFRQAGRPERLPALAANRAAELLDLGRLEAATAALVSARSDASRLGSHVLVARCGAMLGWARALAGDVDRGLIDLEQASVRFGALDMPDDRDLAALRIGEAHLLLSGWSAARTSFQRVLDRTRQSGNTTTRCAAVTGIAAAWSGEGRLAEAEGAVREAIDGWRRLGHLPGLVGALVERAGLQLARDDRDGAVGTVLEASDLLDEAGVDVPGASRWPIQRLYVDLRLVDALLPDHEAAEPIAVAAVERADTIGIPLLRCRAVRRLATVRLARGAVEEATELLYETIEIGELLRARLPHEAQRLSFGDEVDAALVALIRVRLDEGTEPAVAEAAALADRRRDRVLNELVDGSLQPDELELPPETIRLRASIGATSHALLDRGSGPRADALREHVDALVDQLRRSMPDVERRGGTAVPAPSRRGEPVLAAPTTIAYTDLDGEIVATVTRDGATRAVRDLTDRDALQRLLEDLDGELWGGGIDRGTGRNAAALVQSAHHVLRRLGRLLLDPVTHLLPRASPPRRVAVIPHGVLHDVPFHALVTAEGPLLDLAAVTICPTASFAEPVRRRAGPRSVLALGVPTVDAPGIVDELAAFPACGFPTEVLIGREVTREALSSLADQADIIHLACHGQFDEDLPSSSRLRLADGWLAATEIARLDLRDTTVVLSACDSARLGYRGPGAQTLGISRALLAAGARCVVASRWLLDDEHASSTIAAFARHLMATSDPAAALRLAQIEQRERTPHPAHWAPFAVLGHPHHPEVER
jgi:tetratricopeptide (TPR) repeat protein